jgi:hypothetical protein
VNCLRLLPLALALLACGGGRAPAAESDEAYVRRALSLPPDAALVSLRASPATPGTFGREGLRIEAEFGLAPAQVERFRREATSDWRPAPVSPAVAALRRPPPLDSPPGAGLYVCRLTSYPGGQMNKPVSRPCDGAEGEYAEYRFALLEEGAGRLRVVFQNFY